MTERELLAAEHALRLLTGAELMEAHRLEAEDLAFRAEVEAWQLRFAPLLDEIAPREPGPELWPRIARAVDAGLEGVLAGAALPSADVLTLKRRVRVWQALTGLAAAAAVVLALLLPLRTAPPAAPPAVSSDAPLLIASLGDPKAPGVVAVTFVAARAELLVAASALGGESARDYQLWIIPAGGAPVSLGLLPADRPVRRRLPPALVPRFRAGATIALSLEPAGGSPTGQPTGPVVASGPLRPV